MPETPTIPGIDYGVYTCRVLIKNLPMADSLQLVSVQVKQAYQHIGSATILLKQPVSAEDGAVPALAASNLPVPGVAITIKAVRGADEIDLFSGFIVRQKYKNASTGTRLEITAKNKAVNLSLQNSTEVFAAQTDKDIVEALVGRHGCTFSASSLGSPVFPKHTHLVKHGVSDWDFCNLRAEANGCYLYTDGDKIVWEKPALQVDPLRIVQARYGDTIYSLELETDERDYQYKDEMVSFNLSSLENETAAEDEAPNPLATVKGSRSVSTYRTFNEMENTAMLGAVTSLKALSRWNGLVQVKASLAVKIGDTLRIAGFTTGVDGDYIITAVVQDYSDGGFSTWLQVGLNGESYSRKFNLDGGSREPVIHHGLVTALEGDPDNLYRIAVKIAGWPAAQESLWARLSTLYAGDGHGLVWLPEIGDEVLVGFSGTGLDGPVVLGSAFSPALPPHTGFADDNFKKGLVTKKGMRWTWDDEKGVHEISTPAGNKILLSEDEHAIIITDENANKIELTQSGISLTASKEITIKATTSLKLEGATVDINASGNATIKGAMVMIN